MNSDSQSAPRTPARILSTDPASLAEAARILLAGGLVAVPTETVYGLAADATNGAAVTSIYTAKGRPITPRPHAPAAALTQAAGAQRARAG